ncbi:hypothetical protein C8J57DRAFT_1731610 [Mycena rebaudengoi]|nr:hypothetical protein C8J57DRAFT_1731610 [Mycena rebaudengoi]
MHIDVNTLSANINMAAYLTFTSTDILNSSLLTPNGAIRYTISTTSKNKWNGLKHRATTVVTVSPNLTGIIGWESEILTIGGVERPWSTLGQRAFATIPLGKEEWTWGDIPYTLYLNTDYAEWTARQTHGLADIARLEERKNGPPALVLSSAELGDDTSTERMFMVLVMIMKGSHVKTFFS